MSAKAFSRSRSRMTGAMSAMATLPPIPRHRDLLAKLTARREITHHTGRFPVSEYRELLLTQIAASKNVTERDQSAKARKKAPRPVQLKNDPFSGRLSNESGRSAL